MNRGKLLFAFVLPCAASALGCAPSAPARARTTTVLGAAPALRRDASVVDSGVVQARDPSVTLYALGSVQCVFGPNRERLFVAGGFRARVEGGVAQLATESLADAISNVAHTAHGYVFVSSSGAVVRSNEFIGALTRMPDLPNEVAYQGISLSLGRLAVTLAPPVGGLFVTDGRSAFERVDALAGIDAAAARFIDAQHGLVLGIDNELVTTRDGVRWESIDTRGRDFDFIAISEDRRRWNLVEYGTLRSFVMELEGPIQPSRGEEPANDECTTTTAEADAVLRAIRARYPSVDDATVAGVLPTQRTIRLEHPVSRAPVELPGYSCTRQGTRAWVWVKCTLPRVDDRPLGVVAVAEAPAESGQYRTVAAIDPASAIQFLDDAESAIWISDDRPADGDAGAGASTLVVASGAGAIRRWPLSRGGYGIRGVTNGYAVLAALSGPSPSVAIVDTRSGAITEHRVSPSHENVEVRGTVSVDGTALVRFGAAHSESREVFVIPRGERPRTITLPTGVREAAMFDRERGVAASGTGGLWVTSNGGSSWTELAVPVDGVRAPFGREETINVARCSSRGCLVFYSRLLTHLSVTWGTQRASSASPLAIDRRTAPRPARSPGLLPRLRCETVRSTAAERPPSSRAPASATRTTLFGTGTAVLSTWADRGRTMVELSWRGVDGAVAYEAASAPTPMDTAWARGSWSTPHLAAVSPRGALLVLCPERDAMATNERPPPPRCQYRLAPTAAAIQRIDGRRTFYAVDSGFAAISEDGLIWTWGASGIGDIRALDARGARLASASLSQPLEPLWRGILREGASSRAVVSAPSSLNMLNTGDLNGRPTPFDRQHMAIDPPSVCRSPVAANARRMIVSESGESVNGAAFTDIVVRLAESSDGFCVERVDSAAFPSLTASTSSTLLAQPDGSLDGTRAIEGGTREVLHCTLASP